MGHACDDCLGHYSNDPSLKAQFDLDMNDLSSRTSSQISYFLVPNECCAELVAGLIGSDADSADTVKASFPRTLRWLKTKLNM